MLVVCIQVNERDMVNYTGVGEPPFCMIEIKAASNETTPANLKFTVGLEGLVKAMELSRKAGNPSGQLLYGYDAFP